MSYNLLPNGPIPEQVQTLTVVIDLSQAQPIGETVSVDFIPDKVMVSCCYAGQQTAPANIATFPAYTTINGGNSSTPLGLTIFGVEASNFMTGTTNICICNGNNTYNPVYEFYNWGRTAFRNQTISFRVTNLEDNVAITDANAGSMILTMKFLRYRTSDER